MSWFERRIAEENVARILNLIAAPPNRRVRATEADLSGDFEFWFDGGACIRHTGSSHYAFADGTTAFVAVPAAWLWISIKFPDGEVVDVIQRREREDPGPLEEQPDSAAIPCT